MKLDENLKEWQAKLPNWNSMAAARLGDALETLLDHKSVFKAEGPKPMKPSEVEKLFPDGPLHVSVKITGADLGSWHFLFPRPLAAHLADLTLGNEEGEFDENKHPGAFAEFMDQILVSLRRDLSAVTGKRAGFEPAEVSLEATDFMKRLKTDPVVRWELQIDGSETSFFLQSFSPEMLPMLEEAPAEPKPSGKFDAKKVKQAAQAVARPPSFEDFSEQERSSTTGRPPRNLDMLLDINLPITIELGRTSMQIREVLELGPGSVLELDKLSGEPVDIFVNDRKFARGEVVVIEENFGVRITELLKLDERLKGLQ